MTKNRTYFYKTNTFVSKIEDISFLRRQNTTCGLTFRGFCSIHIFFGHMPNMAIFTSCYWIVKWAFLTNHKHCACSFMYIL